MIGSRRPGFTLYGRGGGARPPEYGAMVVIAPVSGQQRRARVTAALTARIGLVGDRPAIEVPSSRAVPA